MSKESGPKPLPLNFYSSKAWLKSLVLYYVEEHQLLPAGPLMFPLTVLTRAIENVINIYGNFPLPTYKFFKQCINPLFEPNEYYNTIYLQIRNVADKENKPDLYIMAENLLYLRRIFEKDKEYIEDAFSKELDLMDGEHQERVDQLTEILHQITKVHVNQVAKMIKAKIDGS
tara:strand:+ start:127 stop:642 length:516 start_codon:yes stop_codon:yes gene_type:complete